MDLVLRILCFVIVSCVTVDFSMACSCLSAKPEQIFCTADWVSHVYVIGSMPEPTQGGSSPSIVYIRVKHLNPLKVPESMIALPSIIVTPYDNSRCGIKVGKGREYILAGNLYDGVLYSGLCDQFSSDDGHLVAMPSYDGEKLIENIDTDSYTCS